MSSISRARAKIQNEYQLFQADLEVAKYRRGREENEKNKQLADKPSEIPEISFYVDESGKTGKYLIVGGLCCLDGSQSYKPITHLTQWKQNKNISYEFHFSDLSRYKLPEYKDFFTQALSHCDTISFKAVVLEQAGMSSSLDEAIRELHYQLVYKSIQHEVATKRMTLPQDVNLFKDQEGGKDKLAMARLEQDLNTAFSQNFSGEAKLTNLAAIDSSDNFYIQLADLFIGSIGRILNRKEDAQMSHKDELAHHIMSLLRLELNDQSTYQDAAFVHFM